MGELPVPAKAYYGASTQRAVENFPISALRFPRRLIRAVGLIKRAAAETNRELGLFEGVLEERVVEAMIDAAQEVADGKFDADFVVDILHTRNHRPTLQMREAWPRLTNIHYVGPVPAALEASSAARTVFDNSMAIVIGPTPPGTGEIAFAFRRTASKSTSPTVR